MLSNGAQTVFVKTLFDNFFCDILSDGSMTGLITVTQWIINPFIALQSSHVKLSLLYRLISTYLRQIVFCRYIICLKVHSNCSWITTITLSDSLFSGMKSNFLPHFRPMILSRMIPDLRFVLHTTLFSIKAEVVMVLWYTPASGLHFQTFKMYNSVQTATLKTVSYLYLLTSFHIWL